MRLASPPQPRHFFFPYIIVLNTRISFIIVKNIAGATHICRSLCRWLVNIFTDFWFIFPWLVFPWLRWFVQRLNFKFQCAIDNLYQDMTTFG